MEFLTLIITSFFARIFNSNLSVNRNLRRKHEKLTVICDLFFYLDDTKRYVMQNRFV